MGQLMFYLKSPHIKQRKKYVLHVERILRDQGLSLFETELSVRHLPDDTRHPPTVGLTSFAPWQRDTRELASYFDQVAKREAQAKDHANKDTAKIRSTWRAYM
jgi:hypothetical protein